MPALTIEHGQTIRTGAIARRVVIGRWATNGVVIDDPSVSRLHAWIGSNGSGCFIVDLRSRTGTRVNGEFISDRHALADGDRIEIGAARLVYHEREEVDAPAFSARVLNGAMPDEGILFDCVCDTPFWAPAKHAGRVAECRHCLQKINIPLVSGERATRCADQSAKVGSRGRQRGGTTVCSICQWSINDGDRTTPCPECGLVFHEDCWRENEGCSAYGCGQVNILRPQDRPHRPAVPSEPERRPTGLSRHGSLLILLGSVMAAALSLVSFGLPSLLMLLAAALYIGRCRGEKRFTLGLIGMALSLLAMVAGLVVSYLWWSS